MASISRITKRRRRAKRTKIGKKRKYEIRKSEKKATEKVGKILGII